MKRTFCDLVKKNVFHRRKEVCVATRYVVEFRCEVMTLWILRK